MTALFFLVAWLRSRRLDGGDIRQTAPADEPKAEPGLISSTVSTTRTH